MTYFEGFSCRVPCVGCSHACHFVKRALGLRLRTVPALLPIGCATLGKTFTSSGLFESLQVGWEHPLRWGGNTAGGSWICAIRRKSALQAAWGWEPGRDAVPMVFKSCKAGGSLDRKVALASVSQVGLGEATGSQRLSIRMGTCDSG